jgi:hypothetical protein
MDNWVVYAGKILSNVKGLELGEFLIRSWLELMK